MCSGLGYIHDMDEELIEKCIGLFNLWKETADFIAGDKSKVDKDTIDLFLIAVESCLKETLIKNKQERVKD
jgi:hypothetical protein